ncbi:hypothetical protein BGW39_006526 [Mortierella sp. 14UC]|nr:hypothetical protein BGW39_006526 [Mortierella sp. 14UC]
MPSQPLTDTEKQLIDAYNTILEKPFVDKYEDRWEDEPFDRAIDLFKSRAQEIGFADPFELLSKFKIESYETVRAQHKKGPALCFRQGWKSPILGTRVDPLVIASKCEHLAGPEFTGQERIVVLDFWASWCDPCLQASPEVSQLAEEFAGQVAFLGINNESMFQKGAITQPPNLDRIIAFVEEHQDEFRYTILIDNAEGFAKDAVYKAAGYKGIPCAVLLVDGIVQYVGSPIDTLRPALEQALESISPIAGGRNNAHIRSSSGRSSREE